MRSAPRSLDPEVLETVVRETVLQWKSADGTLTVQSLECHINQATVTTLDPVYFGLDHNRLRADREIG